MRPLRCKNKKNVARKLSEITGVNLQEVFKELNATLRDSLGDICKILMTRDGQAALLAMKDDTFVQLNVHSTHCDVIVYSDIDMTCSRLTDAILAGDSRAHEIVRALAGSALDECTPEVVLLEVILDLTQH